MVKLEALVKDPRLMKVSPPLIVDMVETIRLPPLSMIRFPPLLIVKVEKMRLPQIRKVPPFRVSVVKTALLLTQYVVPASTLRPLEAAPLPPLQAAAAIGAAVHCE